ncbi:MAG: glycoside hydrolase family 172 protein [Candidatus Neomarinimicrobiota bacterium]
MMYLNRPESQGGSRCLATLMVLLLSFVGIPVFSLAQHDLLIDLGTHQDFRSNRISSFDTTGGNRDAVALDPGETAVLAEIEGPGAIHHIWITVSAEPFYGRKIILKMYWDGEETPSVVSPVGDFFSVGHGLDRNLSSLPISCSSYGRARNCYWYMPFRKSARITATNEGSRTVGSFYYYRELPRLSARTPYFHAQYRQETPCIPGENYLILDTAGKGHYVGCNLSILQRAMGWWGEGDDMIYIDGEKIPSLHGTGSEDYFSDAWGMREDDNLFYGCPLQESDFQTGSKATVYRFHIPDPIPFEESIRVAIEHGHANNRSDYFSSVAYWYQDEPHVPFPLLAAAPDRLPFALESSWEMTLPTWKEVSVEKMTRFEDSETGMTYEATNLYHFLSSFYNQNGTRYPVLMTDGADVGDKCRVAVPVDVGEQYNVDLFFLRGKRMGSFEVEEVRSGKGTSPFESKPFQGFSREESIEVLKVRNVFLHAGLNTLVLNITGKDPTSQGTEVGYVAMTLSPSSPRYVTDWNLFGPFEAPDMTFLQVPYPPESQIDLQKKYPGADSTDVSWEVFQAGPSGYIRLDNLFTRNERSIVYGLVYLFSPDERKSQILLGSDDGVRLWLNDVLTHNNPAYRGAYPDQDRVDVLLKKGWNKLLVKILQGAGGWGFYVRFVDPDGDLTWTTQPPP